ncbi:MAG: HEPN domain-containing protein [Candidatus Diapherotrites archaeon]|nr:HEPN domain-containing protein [Candidatus Diapherotrites archaeon]
MEFGETDSKVPKSGIAMERALNGCIKRKRIQGFSKEDAKTFLAKAHYHLQTAESFESDSFLDWAVIAYYSGMYMAAKAFTAHFSGTAAKDHGCTIALMLQVLKGKKFAKKLGSARKKFEQEIELLGKVRQYRNSALYTVTEVKENDVRKIAKNAFEFVEEIDKLLK